MANPEDPKAVLDAPGQSCALLTPLIKQEITKLESGDVLEIRSDDPSAREGVPAWSRLTGNELVDQVEDGEFQTRFFIRKK
jgi:TusA-related sulfurtransferase